MSRLLCLLTLTLGLAQGVAAQEQSQQTPQAQATPQAAPLETSFSPASLPASQDAAASDATTQTTHKVSRMLSEKFGVARAKAEQISAAVMSAASKYSLPPALLLAIISIESRFKEKAHGANGATGLMQVVPAAHRRLVRNIDLTQAEANIEAGSAILHGYVESAQGDVGAALKSYGGSKAYAEKVSLQVQKFAPQTALQTASEATPD
jgi:soluble lytic murein transglycosylase-like protein